MTPEEHAIYDNHPHDVATYGDYAGLCCMKVLDIIERLRKAPTLFDEEL
jgi:hypothetical protein